MVTVVARIRLDIPESESLKDKRRVLKSLMTRMRNKFNVSVAEIDDNDFMRSATIAAAVVSNSHRFGESVIAQVVNLVEATHSVRITDYQVESY